MTQTKDELLKFNVINLYKAVEYNAQNIIRTTKMEFVYLK